MNDEALKELDYIKDILKQIQYYNRDVKIDNSVYDSFDIVENALKSNQEAESSEALKMLNEFKGIEISEMPFKDECGHQELDLNEVRNVGSQLNEQFHKFVNVMEKALTTKSKKEQAFEIIKKKFKIKIIKLDDGTSLIGITRKGSKSIIFNYVKNDKANLLKEAILNE